MNRLKRWIWVVAALQMACSSWPSLLNAQTRAPANPPTPPPPTQLTPDGNPYLPIVIVNDSGHSPSEVNFVIKGLDLPAPSTTPVVIDYTGPSFPYGVRTPVSVGQNTNTYSLNLSDCLPVPNSNNAYYVYSPEINSGAIWFSIGNTPLNIPVISAVVAGVTGPSFQDPNFLSATDSNYDTTYDIFEYTYGTNLQSVGADSTAVSFFSIPLYGFMSTPNGSSLSNSGLWQAQNTVFNTTVQNYFNQATESAQWNKLLLYSTIDTSQIMRIASTGKASTAPNPFDPNYLDNAEAYGYSYIADIWNGPTAYYGKKINGGQGNSLTMTLPTPPFRTYVGQVEVDGTFKFKAQDGNVVTFSPPTQTPFPTTSQAIFAGIDMHDEDTSDTGDGVQVSKLFQEAVIVGILPTTDTISLDYLVNNQSNYYQVNGNLSAPGPTTGPWYDVYSAALHSYVINTGSPTTNPTIYTFAYDDTLWPQVLISTADVTTNPETYLGVTVGNVTSTQAAAQVLISSSANPSVPKQSVTLQATVVGTGNRPPTGIVTFIVNGQEIGRAPVIGGVATLKTDLLPQGNYTIQVTYSGDRTYRPVISPTTTQIVAVQTETTIVSSQDPSNEGDAVTFTATVTPVALTDSPLTGTVAFSIDDVTITNIPLVDGKASYTIKSLSPTIHIVDAAYSGDEVYASSNSFVIQVVGGNQLTATTANPSQINAEVVFTYTIKTPDSAPLPTGDVAFYIDDQFVGVGIVIAGAASYLTDTLSLGTHKVTARYSGDYHYKARTSNTLYQSVVAYNPVTAVTLTSSANPSSAHSKITFTATLSSSPSAPFQPKGEITFYVDGKKKGSTPLRSSGKAYYSTSSLSPGVHEIIAVFTPTDNNFDPSTANVFTEVIE